MKRIVSLPLILSFVGIAVFGFALFDMGPGHVGDCAASIVDGTVCPTTATDTAAHHLSAWQIFTTTFVSFFSSLTILVASLLLIVATVALFYKHLPYARPSLVRQRLRDFALHSSYSRQKIVSWLSLFELSPAS